MRLPAGDSSPGAALVSIVTEGAKSGGKHRDEGNDVLRIRRPWRLLLVVQHVEFRDFVIAIVTAKAPILEKSSRAFGSTSRRP